IGQHDQVLHAALVGERARAARDLHPGLFQPRRQCIERGGVLNLPAEEAHAFAAVRADHDALLAVVHAQREALRALVDELHAEEVGAEARPVLQRLGPHADVTETLNIHARPPYSDAGMNMALPAGLGNSPSPVTRMLRNGDLLTTVCAAAR